jgi:hypothetical protein
MPLADYVDDAERILAELPTAPRLYHHPSGAFRHLLTREEVDALIDRDCLAMQHVALLKDGGPVDPRAYADGDMPRRGYLRRHLDEGGTLSLRALERLVPAIAAEHRALAEETGYGVHANAYYTPGGKHGLYYHYDGYVTLIVQLAGAKEWPVHAPFVDNPVREYDSFHLRKFTDQERAYLANTPPEETFTLHPGDVLWLPRGWVHSPHAADGEPSLHITWALKERTEYWIAAQITDRVLAQALTDPELRAGIPPAEVLGDLAPRVADIRSYLVGLLMKTDPRAAARAIQTVATQP